MKKTWFDTINWNYCLIGAFVPVPFIAVIDTIRWPLALWLAIITGVTAAYNIRKQRFSNE